MGSCWNTSTPARDSTLVALQPLVGSCWNDLNRKRSDVADELQPLVGSCWNSRAHRSDREAVSLQPLVGSCWNPTLRVWRSRRFGSFNPSWGPAGTVDALDDVGQLCRFNPSWGPAGTIKATSMSVGKFASTPRGVLLELRPLLTGRSRLTSFNPSWGPAGTQCPSVSVPLSGLLQPLVGSCWNGVLSRSMLSAGQLQPLVGSCWNRVFGVRDRGYAAASTPRGVLLEL